MSRELSWRDAVVTATQASTPASVGEAVFFRTQKRPPAEANPVSARTRMIGVCTVLAAFIALTITMLAMDQTVAAIVTLIPWIGFGVREVVQTLTNVRTEAPRTISPAAPGAADETSTEQGV
ncbi:hypothetical protein [Streptomyces virginiae]